MAGLFTLGVFARNLLRENRRKNIFFFILRYIDTWPDTNPGFMPNKPNNISLIIPTRLRQLKGDIIISCDIKGAMKITKIFHLISTLGVMSLRLMHKINRHKIGGGRT